MSTSRVLVIEDDPAIAEIVSRIASDMGFQVCSTSKFNEIPSLYETFNPHIIMLDLIMPGMDGFETLSYLHSVQSTSHIVILSGQMDYRAMAARMGEGMKLNIAGNVGKPFRVSEIRKILDSITNNYQPEQQQSA